MALKKADGNSKMKRKAYEKELHKLQVDLCHLQDWVKAKGARILDTRDPSEFAAAHLGGSINIGLGGQFATWAGTVLDRSHSIVIVATPGRENEARNFFSGWSEIAL